MTPTEPLGAGKSASTTEPFPDLDSASAQTPALPSQAAETRQRDVSDTSFTGRIRSASKKFEESNPPKGAWEAAGSLASSVPSIKDIRRGVADSEGSGGLQDEGRYRESNQLNQQQSIQSIQTGGTYTHASNLPQMTEEEYHNSTTIPTIDSDEANTLSSNSSPSGKQKHAAATLEHRNSSDTDTTPSPANAATPDRLSYRTTPFDNGYQFPPKRTWAQATMIGCKAFWKFTCTWFGFLIVVYGLNVVAWGGMIFLLLCNAAPAMCTPTCNDINSPRRIWIEIDAQVLTALFSVTGFGLIPWRFRDLWYLMKYRLRNDEVSLRRLAGIHRGWFRLQGSQDLPVKLGPGAVESEASTYTESSLPFPLKSIPDAPLTGIRSPPTAVWKLDFVIWMYVWNTFLQAVLSGIMWGLNRYDRPSWATGLFVALACIVAAAGGIMVFIEGKKVKGVEGVPVSDEDLQKLREDREAGIIHINNLSGKPPKEKKTKKQSRHSTEKI